MKRKFFAFILLLMAGLSLSSCLNSDDDTNIEYTHDTAITAFSLGTLTRYYKGVSSTTGNDTIYSAEVTGAKYKFYIDQTTRQIYNVDSLPVGSKSSAVLATITAKNSSPLVWVLKDKDNKDSLSYYSSSDSIDFSSPRQIRVYNNDFSAYATYTITVNVHKEGRDSFVWRSLAQQSAELAALTGMKALSVDDAVYVFGKVAGQLKIYQSADTDGRLWSAVEPNVAFSEEAYKSAITKDDVIYILNGGTVYQSKDAASWTEVATDASLVQLIGASTKYLYAYTAAGISVSKDNGVTWTPETLDADAAYLPTKSLSLTVAPIRSTRNAENLLLLGNRDESMQDSITTLWTHAVDYNVGASADKWNYVAYDAVQGGKLPYLSAIQVATNDSGYVAIGAGKFGEKYQCKWYKSKTGLEWSVDSTVVMPADFHVNMPVAFVRDSNHYYWVINNGSVWKGRYNRDGWRKD